MSPFNGNKFVVAVVFGVGHIRAHSGCCTTPQSEYTIGLALLLMAARPGRFTEKSFLFNAGVKWKTKIYDFPAKGTILKCQLVNLQFCRDSSNICQMFAALRWSSKLNEMGRTSCWCWLLPYVESIELV